MLKHDEIVKGINMLQLRSAVDYTKRTGNVKFHCPFHVDKTPSMFIHMTQGIYRCFSCNKSGTMAGLFWDITSTSLYKTLDIATDQFSNFDTYRDVPKIDHTKPKKVDIKIDGRKQAVDSNSACIMYLRKRGISFNTAKALGLSYMKSGKINFVKYESRLLIPVLENGKLLSVEGRAVDEVYEGPKVLYPKGSSTNTLFDIDNLDKSKPLYVVEGLTDLMVLREDSHFANSTSIFGAGITARQLYLLEDYDVISIPNKDLAGYNTVKKMVDGMSRSFRILAIPNLEQIGDVGDFVTKLHSTVKKMRSRGWGRDIQTPETYLKNNKPS